MSRARAWYAAVGACLLTVGCGASAPRESDIFHDPALRPTILQTSETDGPFLAHLSAVDDGPVEIAGRTAGATYHAASGVRCRSVEGAEPALVCEVRPGEWAFVPHVVRGAP